MGCSSSRQIGHEGASPSVRPTTLDTNTGGDGNASSQGLVREANVPGADAHTQHTHESTQATASDGRPNKPLGVPSPVANSPANLTHQPWTPSELQRQREAFFDTRVTGSSEVWAALKVVCELLRNGDISGAQGMLDVTGLTCPTGSVVGERQASRSGRGSRGGVYDARGALYDVPGWVVADPQDLVEEEEELEEKNERFIAATEMGETRAEEKANIDGVNIGEVVKVKARLSGKEMDVVVSIGMEQKVGVLVDKIKVMANVRSVRLALFGRMLNENQKLRETAWAPGNMLNAFVFD